MDCKTHLEVLGILARAVKVHARVTLDDKTLPLYSRDGKYMGAFPLDKVYQLQDEGRVSIDLKGAHQV